MMRHWKMFGIVFVAWLCAPGSLATAIAQGDDDATPQAAEVAQAEETVDNPFAKAIDWAQHRVVKLYGGGIGREHGYATGLIVSPEGHILVAHGVYITGIRLQVTMPDGRVYNAEVVRRSEGMQVVLLKIDAETPEYFELPEEPVARKGDWVIGVSNVFKVADRGEPLSVNLGIVSLRTEIDAKKRAQDLDLEGEVLVIDAITSNPGNPGGALITADRKLAGMIGKLIQSKSTNTWLNYAIPSDRLALFVAGKDVAPPVTATDDARAYLGIRVFKLNARSPAYIDRVTPDSPAAEAGLATDDLILAIDGQIIRNVRDYEEQLGKLRVGQEVTLIYKRKDDVFSTKITPVPEPQ